jgi:amidase
VLESLFANHNLDALFIPVNGPAWKTDWLEGDRFSFGGTSSLAAVSGYPSVVVPAGDVRGLPIAVGFVGTAFSEAQLIQIAYVFEQATHARIDPQFVPSLEVD